MKRSSLSVLPVLLALAVVPGSKTLAQSCGDFVVGTVVLSADLHCTGGYTALGISADNTVIELNGHTLSGSSGLMGIDVSSFENVTIRGPGRIKGFWLGVGAGNGKGLTVENVRFEGVGSGISDAHGTDARILDNQFIGIGGTAIDFTTTPWSSRHSTGGLIADNWFDGGSTAIELCGMNTYGHRIENNRIRNQSWVAMLLIQEAHGNELFGNDVDFSYAGLGLFNASQNTVRSDRYSDGTLGVWMASQPVSVHCANSGVIDTAENTLKGVSLFRLQTAAQFGGTGYGGQVMKNLLTHSKLYDNDRGTVLEADTYANSIVDNAFHSTATPILDAGSDNVTAPNWCDRPGC